MSITISSFSNPLWLYCSVLFPAPCLRRVANISRRLPLSAPPPLAAILHAMQLLDSVALSLPASCHQHSSGATNSHFLSGKVPSWHGHWTVYRSGLLGLWGGSRRQLTLQELSLARSLAHPPDYSQCHCTVTAPSLHRHCVATHCHFFFQRWSARNAREKRLLRWYVSVTAGVVDCLFHISNVSVCVI